MRVGDKISRAEAKHALMSSGRRPCLAPREPSSVSLRAELRLSHVCPALLHLRRLPPGLLPLRARGGHRQPQAHRPWPCVPSSCRACTPSHVPADVLVIPTRVVPRLADLKHDELASLMASVQHVGRVIERVYAADGLTIACQVRILHFYIHSSVHVPAHVPAYAFLTGAGWQSRGPDRAPRPLPSSSPEAPGRPLRK